MKSFVLCVIYLCWSVSLFTNTDSKRPPLLGDLTKMNGTWEEYKKTKNFPLNLSCLTYNLNCTNNNDTKSCTVELIQKIAAESGNTTNYTLEQVANGTFFFERTEPLNISLDEAKSYAVVWRSNEENDQLLVLVRNLKETKDDEINKIIDMWQFPNDTIKKIDHSPCGSCYSTIVSPILITISIILLKLSVLEI